MRRARDWLGAVSEELFHWTWAVVHAGSALYHAESALHHRRRRP